MLSSLPYFLFSERKMPAVQTAVNTAKDILVTFISTSGDASASVTPSIKPLNMTVTMTMLRVFPTDLIVASIEDATP